MAYVKGIYVHVEQMFRLKNDAKLIARMMKKCNAKGVRLEGERGKWRVISAMESVGLARFCGMEARHQLSRERKAKS